MAFFVKKFLLIMLKFQSLGFHSTGIGFANEKDGSFLFIFVLIAKSVGSAGCTPIQSRLGFSTEEEEDPLYQ